MFGMSRHIYMRELHAVTLVLVHALSVGGTTELDHVDDIELF